MSVVILAAGVCSGDFCERSCAEAGGPVTTDESISAGCPVCGAYVAVSSDDLAQQRESTCPNGHELTLDDLDAASADDDADIWGRPEV